jgi:hypothetical protein
MKFLLVFIALQGISNATFIPSAEIPSIDRLIDLKSIQAKEAKGLRHRPPGPSILRGREPREKNERRVSFNEEVDVLFYSIDESKPSGLRDILVNEVRKWQTLPNDKEKAAIFLTVVFLGRMLCSKAGMYANTVLILGGEWGAFAASKASSDSDSERAKMVSASSARELFSFLSMQVGINGYSQATDADSLLRSESYEEASKTLEMFFPLIECMIESSAACMASGDDVLPGVVVGLILGLARKVNLKLAQGYKFEDEVRNHTKHWGISAMEQIIYAFIRILGATAAALFTGKDPYEGGVLGLLGAGSLVGVNMNKEN